MDQSFDRNILTELAIYQTREKKNARISGVATISPFTRTHNTYGAGPMRGQSNHSSKIAKKLRQTATRLPFELPFRGLERAG
jgi:hypothetical protein